MVDNPFDPSNLLIPRIDIQNPNWQDPAFTQGDDAIPYPPPDVDNPPPVISSLPLPDGAKDPTQSSKVFDPTKDTATQVDISQLPNPDQPKYDDNFVDANGVPGNIHKYQAIQQSQGDDAAYAHMQNDGYDPKDFQKVTQAPQQSGSIIGSANAGEAGEQVPDKDLQDAQDAIARSKLIDDKTIGPLLSATNSINENILKNVVAPLISAGGSMGLGEASQDAATVGQMELSDKLATMGRDFMYDPSKSYQAGSELFQALGLTHGHDNTYMNDAGNAVLDTLATSMLIHYGTARIATEIAQAGGTTIGNAVTKAARMAAAKYDEAVKANPGMWIASELMSGAGATIGSEKGEDYGTTQGQSGARRALNGLIGGLSGGLVGGGVGFITIKSAQGVMKVSRYFAAKVADMVDDIVSHNGMPDRFLNRNQPEVASALGMRTTPPKIDPDVLAQARADETAARDASQKVVDARVYRDQQVRGTSDHNLASMQLAAALEHEREMTGIADKTWDLIPAEVRGHASRQQLAIRSQFADTAYPQQFAETQVEGEKRVIQAEIDQVRQDLAPDHNDGTPDASRRISDGLWKMRAMAKGRLDKYWNRAPLKKQMPNRSILKALDGLTTSLTKEFQSDKIPNDKMDELREAFGNIKVKPPTLGWMKNFITGLEEKSNRLFARGKNILASNYVKLQSVLMQQIAEAFPDNIPLQQARQASRQYFDLFSRSEIGQYLTMGSNRGPRIHPEDTLSKMLSGNRIRSFSDIQKAVQWLQSKNAFAKGIKDPDKLTTTQKADLEKLQSDAEQGIRSYIEQQWRASNGDPEELRKFLSDPNFQRQIAPLGKVAGEVKQASQELASLVDRREAIEKSAFAKYVQGDPDVALDKVWKSNDPAMARALMDGSAGVGGFKQDPIAMQGFKAGLIDRFVASSGMDPNEMQSALAQINTSTRKVNKLFNMLDSPKGRLLKSVLSSTEWDRFTSLVNRAVEMSNENRTKNAGNKFKTVLAEMVSLKLLAKMPEFLKAGEGGSLKQASLVSGLAHDVAETMLHNMPASEAFKRALVNPEYEASIYQRIPASTQEAKDTANQLKKSVLFERMLYSTMTTWMGYGDGPKGNPADKQDDDGPFSGLMSTPANASERPPLNPDVLGWQLNQSFGGQGTSPFAMTRKTSPDVVPHANENSPTGFQDHIEQLISDRAQTGRKTTPDERSMITAHANVMAGKMRSNPFVQAQRREMLKQRMRRDTQAIEQ